MNKRIKVYLVIIFVLVIILTGLLATHYYLDKQTYDKVRKVEEMEVVL